MDIRWLDALEMRDEITAVADDLLAVRERTINSNDQRVWYRYPGW